MKKTSIILMLLTASFSMFTSCKKDKDNNGNNTCANPNVSATIESTSYKVCNGYASIVNVLGYNYFEVVSQVNSSHSLSFAFNTEDRSVVVPGSYTLSNRISPYYPSGPLLTSLTYMKDGKIYLSQSGTVTFSIASSTQYKGTFSGIVQNTSNADDVLRITNGSFDVTYR